MSMMDFKVSGEDKLKRTFLLPQEVLWAGDGVQNAAYLLHSPVRQIYVGVPEVTTLSNQEGKKGAVLLDFGSQLAGSLEILASKGISNKAGVRMRIRFGESVSEAMTPIGEKYACNDHAVRDMEVLLTAFSQQTFGYTGYRFVYLELLEADAYIELAAVHGIFTYRDIPYLGTFQCDDPLLERIFDVSAYTVHLNMQNMLWDGIKRDRLVWIGDVHPEMMAIRTIFGNDESIDDCLKFIAETNTLPNWPNNITTYSFWYLKILWDWYWYTGKKELVEELKPYWTGLLEQLFGLIHEEENEILKEEEFKAGFFVDWPTKKCEESKAGVYALFRLALLDSAKLCELVGEKEHMAKCLSYAELLGSQKAIHNDRKQIVALLELAGMLDKETTGRILSENGGHGMSTFMSYYILEAAAKTVGMECAQEMLREYYGAMLEVGATTFWEDFDLDWVREGARIDRLLEPGEYDIHGENGKFCYLGMRHSLCHGWSAGPAAFLADHVLGIQVLEAGCKKLRVKPNLGHLKWVKGSYPTPYGVVNIEARRERNQIITQVDGPQEVQIETI